MRCVGVGLACDHIKLIVPPGWGLVTKLPVCSWWVLDGMKVDATCNLVECAVRMFGMFILCELQDIVRIDPHKFSQDMEQQIRDEISKKFANKVSPGR